jgi:hypothetical protein
MQRSGRAKSIRFDIESSYESKAEQIRGHIVSGRNRAEDVPCKHQVKIPQQYNRNASAIDEQVDFPA